MMEIVCRAYVEDGWAYFTTEAGDRKWGGKFNAKEAEERGGFAMVNATRRAINHVKRVLGRTDLPTGTRLRFDSSLPWPEANELLASTFVLTDDLTPHHRPEDRRRVVRSEPVGVA
jgi:hypothetical protein